MKLRLILLAGAALMTSPAWAQRTVIVPDAAGSALAAGTTAVRSGAVTTIDGGTLAGTNLFHSFSTFNLAAGDTARWTTTLTDPAKVTNVINRVTGGEVSKIAGRFDSTDLPKAAFFFINPAGIVFGKKASVNVPGASWFSTGKSLRFADGSALSATTATGSTFSVAEPKSFGFLGQEGDIAVRGAPALMVNDSAGLGLLAANVQVGSVGLSANQIVIAAVGQDAADFALRGGGAGSADLGGTMRIAHSKLTISPSNNGGGILRPGQMTLRAGKIEISGGKFASNGRCVTADKCKTSETSGAISMSAGEIGLKNLLLSTSTLGTGDAGNLHIHADTLTIKDSKIRSQTVGCKDGECKPGKAGSVSINAAFLTVQRSTISTRSYNAAAAGVIDIVTQKAEFLDGSVLSTSALGSGSAGSLAIRDADSVMLMQDSQILSQTIGCQTGKCGTQTPGKVTIDAGLLKLLGSTISTRSKNSVAAGAIDVHSRRVEILRGSKILSDAKDGSGPAGSITITLPNADGIVRLGIDSSINTSASNLEKAGIIKVTAPLAVISNGGSIRANSQQGGGFVTIASRYFIRSSDKDNKISADGSVEIDSNLYDVSVGTSVPRIEFLDASNLLLGQCASARVTGVTSQLRWHNTGPYTDARRRTRRELGAVVDLLDNPLC